VYLVVLNTIVVTSNGIYIKQSRGRHEIFKPFKWKRINGCVEFLKIQAYAEEKSFLIGDVLHTTKPSFCSNLMGYQSTVL